ncbi:MAG: quinone-dependent dihydroorotate dehydrogenase [Alphaproteobacteria bacterium]|nr:quinone-dependent dihydroorotate dehydrogenase [Alphaproteobacteria bacterium]MBU0797246.1 quinone-dependent dihydroorotate dehydrogenase [Alphaproteobacteria bacterium]MBU0888966.1 quinone-dependent dihydroorotate dehydrogenase [Alphaproteobacteria bacterium]MBU1813986.1 quinone-dependent dihydroorotate dehydrogenase [Alphaproteobacteria bacterium]
MDIGSLALPLLRLLPPETAHDATIRALACGLAPRTTMADDPILGLDLWGRRFANPIGLAAGFDKNAQAFRAILAMGFGFTEIGTVTPRPQEGNPKPRLFRLAEDGAVINRMGFNNQGLAAVRRRLEGGWTGILGANIGKNKDSTDAVADYVLGARAFAPLADYLVINVSSPNTPGLRDLQRREPLLELARAVRAERDAASGDIPPPPLLLKVAPDLDEAQIEDVAEVALSAPVDGVIISNTTIARPETLRSPHRAEAGGLSGAPLLAPSIEVLRRIAQLTGGRMPLVGVGGIASGADAYAKIKAGASLVQLYSALVYHGPGLLPRLKRDLADLLRADGFDSITSAIGVEAGRS